MYSFLETEQCLVWNVFKDKANFAGRVDRMGGGHRFGEHAEAPCIGMSPRTSLPLPRSDCAPLGKSASYFCVWKREQRPFAGSCLPFSDPKETLQCRCAVEITVGGVAGLSSEPGTPALLSSAWSDDGASVASPV